MIMDAKTLDTLLLSAAGQLEADRELINGLNIFPVPDGDTGSNMSMTMAGIRAVELQPNDGVGDLAGRAAAKLLRSARGNSGVILSLFFKGFAMGLAHLERATLPDLVVSIRMGVDCSYKSVMNPTEGTILTVMRRCAEEAEAGAFTADDADLTGFFERLLHTAEATLAETPELLPVLKSAGVVDAGGRGFVAVLRGICSALAGNPVSFSQEGQKSDQKADFGAFESGDIRYPYCTECIVGKTGDYRGEGKADTMRQFIMSVGDSAVFVEDEEIIKLHVHTDDPGKVLSRALEYGVLETVKVENMRKQHTALSSAENEKASASVSLPRKPYGFVAVAAGEGITACFLDLGVDRVIEGGQTMNPSMEDILGAIGGVNAEVVYVLPNNGNIYMAAQQAAKDVNDRTVYVLPTKTIPQGIAAMMGFDGDHGSDTNFKNMKAAATAVKSVSLTYAERDSQFEGKTIRRGQILGLLDHKVYAVADSRVACLQKMEPVLRQKSFFTLFYGKDADEAEAQAIGKLLSEFSPEAEITVLPGGQPVYSYFIAAE